jgi:hypothetical protein
MWTASGNGRSGLECSGPVLSGSEAFENRPIHRHCQRTGRFICVGGFDAAKSPSSREGEHRLLNRRDPSRTEFGFAPFHVNRDTSRSTKLFGRLRSATEGVVSAPQEQQRPSRGDRAVHACRADAHQGNRVDSVVGLADAQCHALHRVPQVGSPKRCCGARA